MNKKMFEAHQVITALEQSAGIISAAAIKLGVSRVTVQNYINDDAVIAACLKNIRESNLDLAETKLLTNLRDGNMTAIIFYLKTQGKERGYIEGREVTGPHGLPIQTMAATIDVSKLSTAALREMQLATIVEPEETNGKPD